MVDVYFSKRHSSFLSKLVNYQTTSGRAPPPLMPDPDWWGVKMASIFIGAITRRPTGFYPFFVPVIVLIYHFVSREGGVAGGTLRAMFVTSPPRKTIFDSKKPSPLLHHSMIHLTSPFGCLLHDKILIRLHLKTKKFPARERWVTKLWIQRHSEDPNRLQHQESTQFLKGKYHSWSPVLLENSNFDYVEFNTDLLVWCNPNHSIQEVKNTVILPLMKSQYPL